jgi:predicted PurR-regulated permease PerM
MPFEGSQVSLRTVFTVSFGVLVVVAVVYAITQMTLAITLTLLATMIAIALDHAVTRLERLGFRRWLAILVVGVLLGGGGVLLGILLISPAASQAQGMARDLPQLVD